MQKKVLAVVLALAMLFSVMLPMTVASAGESSWVDISYRIFNGKLYITAITDDSFNRVALFDADDTAVKSCLKTSKDYTLVGEENRQWTIKLDAPEEAGTYVLRGRSATTGTYLPGDISESFEIRGTGIVKSADAYARSNKVNVTVETIKGYDKVCVVNSSTGAIVGATGVSTINGDTCSWKVSFAYDSSVEKYTVMARDVYTGYYDKSDTKDFTVDAQVDSIVSVGFVDIEDNDTQVILRVTTVKDIERVKIANADDLSNCISYQKTEQATETEQNLVWDFVINVPKKTTEYAVDVAYSVEAGEKLRYEKCYTYATYEVEEVIPEAPAFFAETTANTITDGWYTTPNGLVQVYVGDWQYYGAYGLTLVAAMTAPVSACTIATYEADADDVFAAKTAADFSSVLQETVTSFEAVTVAGKYPGYVAKTATYRNLVFQANGYKYFINYIDAADATDIDAVSERAFNNIVVCPPAPDAEANKNAVADNWYTTNDGLVQMYVGNWQYYGAYGLTLVAGMTAPVSAATVAVYTADSDEVFAAKTAADFSSVLQETVTSFEPVTVAGEYPGYIAKTATYYNLVFQANGYKYFINYINANDGTDVEAAFNAVVESIIVLEKACDHTYGEWEMTTVPTITTVGTETRVCSKCLEEETRDIPMLPAPVAEAANNTVDENGWYKTTDGLVKVKFPATWGYYGSYGITLTSNPASPFGESCVTVAVYTADSDEVFAAKTMADFESVLQTTLTTFEAVTVAGEYPGYIAVNEDGTYHNLVFQANGAKYFINIIAVAGDEANCADIFDILVANVIVDEPAPVRVRPAQEVWNTIDAEGVYTTNDGLVQLQFPATWGYYGSYGITLTSDPASPFGKSCVTVAVYTADSDEVFAAKTMADFESVLQTTLSTFEAVTIDGQYPGYIAVNEDGTYHNLVFQANGAKYFINIIAVAGDETNCANIFDNLVDNVIVYTAD